MSKLEKLERMTLTRAQEITGSLSDPGEKPEAGWETDEKPKRETRGKKQMSRTKSITKTNRPDFIADHRQYLSSGKRNHTSGGWQIMHWDAEREIYVEGAYCATKREAREAIKERKTRGESR